MKPTLRATHLAVALVLWTQLAASGSDPISVDDLKVRIAEMTSGFQDLSMTATATYKDKKALAKVDADLARLYDVKSAAIVLKEPDKLRMDSKLGMIRAEYIINAGKKTVRLKGPAVKVNEVKDYSSDPAKLQDALDIGLITPSLWRSRSVEVVQEPDAEANGEVKLRLRWPKGNIVYYAWLDSANLYLKRFEKHGGDGKTMFRIVYHEPQRVREVIWVPTRAELFTGDGEKAGASQFSDLKVNIGLSDSVFD